MAPALTSQRDTHYEALQDADKSSHRRRALASVDNNALLMEEEDMGLQNQPNLAKDQQEMEQILSDLGNADLAQADLLQAIKTLEGADEGLASADPDSIFPLHGFDLPLQPENPETDSIDDKIKMLQQRIIRRTIYLLRRSRIIQVIAIGKRISEEVAQTFERTARASRKDGAGRTVGLKALVKKIETTAALQASAASRPVTGPKYYRASTSKGDASKSASLGIPSGTHNELEDMAGALRCHLSVVKHGLDSDATESSSGGESDDETVTYNNPHQLQMPIEKRALWTWQKSRAKIAANATWVQAQLQELEYKIRQHNELLQTVRAAKGPVEFDGEPKGYGGSLPGEAPCTCARIRPLRRETFNKRKLLQMHNLHIATNKAAKPSDIRCGCMYPTESCAVCTGRADAAEPPSPRCTLPPAARIALADPGFHPALSDMRDVPPAVHLDALASRPWFRSRFTKAWRGAHHSTSTRTPAPVATVTQPTPKPSGKHPKRMKRGRPPLSRKIKERDKDDDTAMSNHERPRGRPSTEARAWRRQSYDIDNIVIPQSVAANTRPEILTYKEIVTPKWRVMELPEAPMNNGVMKSHRMSFDSEEEDISETAVHARHLRAESRERSRYLRKQRSRRVPQPDDVTNSHDSHMQHAPLSHVQPMSHMQVSSQVSVSMSQVQPVSVSSVNASHMQAVSMSQVQPLSHVQVSQNATHVQINAEPSTSFEHETVRPYSPRHFPLPEDIYRDMLALMPDGYRPSSPEPSPTIDEEDERSSTLSPMSPLIFDGDDPDDAEWNPNVEKSERRRSGLR